MLLPSFLMGHFARGLSLVLLLLFPTFVAPTTVRADAPIEVTGFDAQNQFPSSIVIHTTIESKAMVTEISLHQWFGINTKPAIRKLPFIEGTHVQIEYKVDTIDFPPGGEIAFQLEVQNSIGERLLTPHTRLLYMDSRFTWQTLSARDGLITVYYYRNELERARRAIKGAETALDEMQDRAGVRFEQPFKVMLYSTRADWQLVSPRHSPRYDQQVRFGGYANTVFSLIVLLGDPLFVSSTEMEAIATHEVTHLIVGYAADDNLVAWLNEGLAVSSQPEVEWYYLEALDEAIAFDTLLPVRDIQKLPGRPELVELFYGQSYSLVKFLLEHYSPERMRELLATLRTNTPIDDALQQVYGFDQDGLDAVWRRSLGVPPREYVREMPTPVAVKVALQPMPASSSAEQPLAVAGESASRGIVLSWPILTGLGVITIGLVAGGAWFTTNRRRRDDEHSR